MHINKLGLLLVVLLAGCATPTPVIKVVTQTVEVPVPVACKEELPPVPDYCFFKLAEGHSIFDKTRCLLSDRKLSEGYELELAAKLKACK